MLMDCDQLHGSCQAPTVKPAVKPMTGAHGDNGMLCVDIESQAWIAHILLKCCRLAMSNPCKQSKLEAPEAFSRHFDLSIRIQICRNTD